MRMEEKRGRRLRNALDLVFPSPDARFEFTPEQEFSPEERSQLLASVLEQFEKEEHNRIQSAWLLQVVLPEFSATPQIREEIKTYVQKKRIWLAQVLHSDLRRNEGESFFKTILAFRAYCAGEPEAWPKGKMDQLALEAAEDLLGYMLFQGKSELFWNGIAHHGLYMIDIPELRPVVDRVLARQVRKETVIQAMELQVSEAPENLFDVELHTLARVLKAYQGSDPGRSPEIDLAKVHQMLKSAKRVFARPPHIQVYSVLMLTRCLSLLSADRLEFPPDGPIQPARSPRIGPARPLPERPL